MLRKYRVMINGKNVYTRFPTGIKHLSFFATRYVEAHDEDEAVEIALNMIRKEFREHVLNKPPNGPMLYVEELDELESFPDDVLIPGKGASWYPAKDDK